MRRVSLGATGDARVHDPARGSCFHHPSVYSRVRTGSGRLGGAGSGTGFGVRSGTGFRIGSTTIFLSGFPMSIGVSFPRRLPHRITAGPPLPGGTHVVGGQAHPLAYGDGHGRGLGAGTPRALEAEAVARDLSR